MSLPVVILSTADFDSTVWTNKQHLAVHLQMTRQVVYVESLGLRRPRLTLADLSRIRRRLRGHDSTGQVQQRTGRPQPEVISPRVLPLHGSKLSRAVNQALIDRTVRPKLPPRYLLWSFSPLTYGLEDDAAAFVYHSVDLIHHQPHMPSRAILRAERTALQRADATIASSSGVQRHLRALGAKDVLLWENVADTALFAAAAGTRQPDAVFAGHLTPTKIDIAALQSIVDAGVPLKICGPLPEDGTRLEPSVDRLLRHDRTTYLGNLRPEGLAAVFATCAVGVIPYRLNSYTEGVFPLKVYEYLAAGLTVVSTPLPSLDNLSDEVIRATANEFGHGVAAAARAHDASAERRNRSLGMPHSWEARTAQAHSLIDRLVDDA